MKIFNKLEEWLGATLFIVLFIVMLLQIFTRQVLNSPLIWSEELSRLIFVYVGILGVSIGVRANSHIFIDFIFTKFPKKMRQHLTTAISILILGCILFFFHFGIKVFLKKEELDIVSLGISQKWMYLPLPLISSLMLVRFVQACKTSYEEGKISLHYKAMAIITVVLFALTLFKPELFNVLKLSNYFDFGENAIYATLVIWLVIMLIGVPVGWSLLAASIAYYSMTRWAVVNFAAASLVDSLDSFTLLAVPFFIFTGILMNGGGITERIFNFAKAGLGHYTGGMGHVNVAASLIFSGMSGSAIADAGGLGQLEIKAMRDEGYDDDICGGITAASCIIGPLVPPSISMIIYGVIANQSIAKLFLAGFVPGLLTTIALMIMNYFVCKKRGYKKAKKQTAAQRWTAFKKAFFALLTPVIIIGGIFSGKFTPTEAAVIAAIYSTILGGFIYRELTLKEFFQHCIEAVSISGVTVLMIMTVTFFGQVIAREQVAMKIAEFFVQFAQSPTMVLVMINLLLLFLGMFIDALALQFLVLPMLIPVAQQFGIDMIFFGVMTTLNMMIGILTPPMGMALFVVAQVGKMPVSTVTKGVLPFLIPIALTLILITIFPQIVTFVPNLIMP